MGKFISLGEYNKLYKYIWIYLILRFINTYIFYNTLIFDQFKPNNALTLPDTPFITLQFDYIGIIIISTIIIVIKKFFIKPVSKKVIENILKNEGKDINNEYGYEHRNIFLYVNILFLVIRDVCEQIIPKFKCTMFTYWIFEMFYYELYHSYLFKTKIYKHHIFSFIFILSTGSLLKSIIIIINFANDTDNAQFFDNRKWLIPTSLIFYFLFRIFKVYTWGNIKYYFNKKMIEISNFLLYYGIIGAIITTIGAIISTYVPCGDNTLPELSKNVCSFTNNNQTIHYFDSYNIFHEKLSEEYYTARIFFLIMRSILNFGSNYYIYVICEKLSPLYYICLHRLNVLVLRILDFISYFINNNYNKTYTFIRIFETLTSVFYILGSIVYLEFIELNFCGLNFYTKRNIEKRANTDSFYSIYSLIDNKSELSLIEAEE